MARRILGNAWWAGFTFNGITADGDGYDSLIGGSVNIRVGFARDPELNSWDWLYTARSRHLPLSELCLNHFVQLFSQGWNALRNNLPDGVFLQAEVGMR